MRPTQRFAAATIALPDGAERLFVGVERLGLGFEPERGPVPAAPAGPAGPMVVEGRCVKLW